MKDVFPEDQRRPIDIAGLKEANSLAQAHAKELEDGLVLCARKRDLHGLKAVIAAIEKLDRVLDLLQVILWRDIGVHAPSDNTLRLLDDLVHAAGDYADMKHLLKRVSWLPLCDIHLEYSDDIFCHAIEARRDAYAPLSETGETVK